MYGEDTQEVKDEMETRRKVREEHEKQREFYSPAVEFCPICDSPCSSIGCLSCGR